jgi:hypothetical protein
VRAGAEILDRAAFQRLHIQTRPRARFARCGATPTISMRFTKHRR